MYLQSTRHSRDNAVMEVTQKESHRNAGSPLYSPIPHLLSASGTIPRRAVMNAAGRMTPIVGRRNCSPMAAESSGGQRGSSEFDLAAQKNKKQPCWAKTAPLIGPRSSRVTTAPATPKPGLAPPIAPASFVQNPSWRGQKRPKKSQPKLCDERRHDPFAIFTSPSFNRCVVLPLLAVCRRPNIFTFHHINLPTVFTLSTFSCSYVHPASVGGAAASSRGGETTALVDTHRHESDKPLPSHRDCLYGDLRHASHIEYAYTFPNIRHVER